MSRTTTTHRLTERIALLARMKRFPATVCLSLVCFSAVVHADHASPYEWPAALVVQADLDRSGQLDTAQLGVAAESVGLFVKIDSSPLPIIEIPIDSSQQFGICPGAAPGISVVPQSEAPLNALGETPRGYEICPECVEIVVSGGECDALHFYWDTVKNELSWWRA